MLPERNINRKIRKRFIFKVQWQREEQRLVAKIVIRKGA